MTIFLQKRSFGSTLECGKLTLVSLLPSAEVLLQEECYCDPRAAQDASVVSC